VAQAGQAIHRSNSILGYSTTPRTKVSGGLIKQSQNQRLNEKNGLFWGFVCQINSYPPAPKRPIAPQHPLKKPKKWAAHAFYPLITAIFSHQPVLTLVVT
jgi:hypothetical protein